MAILQQETPAARLRSAEAVHAMRIALRQARAALLFFAPLISGSAHNRLDLEMRWLADRLGGARNADVTIARGHPAKAAEVSWSAHRAVQYGRLIRALNSRRYARLLASLARAAERAQLPHSLKREPGADFLFARLNEWARELGRQGKKLDDLSSKELHRLRVRAKRLRYAAEWCLPHLTPNHKIACRKIEKPAKAIQQTLGDLADVRMHLRLARHFDLPELNEITQLGRSKARRRSLKTANDAFRLLRGAVD